MHTTIKSKRIYLLVALLALLALVGCGGAAPEISEGLPTAAPGNNEAGSAPVTEPEPSAPAEEPVTEMPDPTVVEQDVLRFVAEQYGTSPENISVVSRAEQEWPSAALGCPQPGIDYAQMVTAGYQFILDVQGQTVEVHTDIGNNAYVFCDAESASAEPTSEMGDTEQDEAATDEDANESTDESADDDTEDNSGGEMSTDPTPSATDDSEVGALDTNNLPDPMRQVAQQALTLVENETGLSSEELTLAQAQSVTWNDSSLGCPQPEQMYMQVILDGYQFIFEAEGDRFYVHSTLDGSNMILCDDPQEVQSDPDM